MLSYRGFYTCSLWLLHNSHHRIDPNSKESVKHSSVRYAVSLLNMEFRSNVERLLSIWWISTWFSYVNISRKHSWLLIRKWVFIYYIVSFGLHTLRLTLLQFFNSFQIMKFVEVLKTGVWTMILSLNPNLFSPIHLFKSENRKQALKAKSGKYGE